MKVPKEEKVLMKEMKKAHHSANTPTSLQLKSIKGKVLI